MENGATHTSGVKYEIANLVPGIILYPALMTPAIMVGEEDSLQILLLGKEETPIKKKHVAYQLKVAPGLDEEKKYQSMPLPESWIDDFTPEGTLGRDDVLSLDGHFEGLLDSRAFDLFNDPPGGEGRYTQLYSLRLGGITERLAAEAENDPQLYNLIWVHEDTTSVTPEGPCVELLPGEDSEQLNLDSEDSYLEPRELQDQDIITPLLERRNGDEINGEEEPSRYCFSEGLPTDDAVKNNDPIQSYHPVFYYQERDYFNLAHFADVHLSARQHILEESDARVIEYAVDEDGQRVEEDLDKSPRIGDQVNVTLDNLRDLLNNINEDNDVHAVVIGGDLVDYIKNLYVPDLDQFGDSNVAEIWDRVEIDGDYEDHYQDFVSFISFYSVIVNFYRDATNPKPVYVLTGNHDAYYELYGISPRINLPAIGEVARANPSIPGDHNMTFYEANLIFGETYDEHRGTDALPSPDPFFNTDLLEWFYSVLTPFSDFAIHLPEQCLVGLAWGGSERMITLDPTDGQFGPGLLPRANSVISDRQEGLLEEAEETAGDRPVILTSHSTFVSYDAHDQPLDMDIREEEAGHDELGEVMYDEYGDFDSGTFESNRRELYGDRLALRTFQCVLTGHSHRRALYTIIDEHDPFGGHPRVWTGSYQDFDDFNNIDNEHREPAVIVSDSAGPIPNRNREGELEGYGRDQAGGTKVVFDSTSGDIEKIEKLPVGPNPRFVVALDYMDLIAEEPVIQSFRSDPVSEEEERLGSTSYTFNLELHEEVNRCARVAEITLYIRPTNWHKIEMQPSGDNDSWRIPDYQKDDFRMYFYRLSSPQIIPFMAMSFDKDGERAESHDFGSSWCFPIRIDRSNRRYVIERNADDVEEPNFRWRRQNIDEKYT